MAYENINVSELKSSLRKIDDINNNKLKSLSSSIDSGNWSGNSRTRIVEALKTVSSYYDNIKTNIEMCKTVANYIEEYKDIVKENDTYNTKIEKIKNNNYNYFTYDKYGGSKRSDKLNPESMSLVNDYVKKINSNKAKLKQIEVKVNSLLNS